MNKLNKERQYFNKKILNDLRQYLEINEWTRFGQALVNLGIIQIIDGKVIDPFYEESIDMYKRLPKEIFIIPTTHE